MKKRCDKLLAESLKRRKARLIMFERLKEIVTRLAGKRLGINEPPDEPGDRDAGVPVPGRPNPPNHGSLVAVAEPDEDV